MAPDRLPPADRSSVFVNAPMGVALCTPVGTLLDVNAALGRLLDRDPDQLTGRSLLALTHPDFEMTEPSALPGAVHVKGRDALESYCYGWAKNWSETEFVERVTR